MKYSFFLPLLLAISLNLSAQHQFLPITLQNASGKIHTPHTPPPFNSTSPLLHQQNQFSQKREAQNRHLIQQHLRQRSQQNNAIRTEIIQDKLKHIQYELPSFSQNEDAKAYYQAYMAIKSMLENEDNLNLKDAVFMVESAYFNRQLDRNWFQSEIDTAASLILSALVADGYDSTDTMARKMYLQKYMTDTLVVRNEQGKIEYENYPKRYDFDDLYGKKQWTNMFVSKLLATGSGQCHSLPLLYLILAEQLGIDAHLSFSPEHSFIKLQDDNRKWYNLELTNGHFTTDAWLLSSGYVKAASIRSGIYMRPLSKKETIAHCLFDLAYGYSQKFGIDSFVLQCTEEVLKHDPKNIFVWQLLSDYHVYWLDFTARQIGYPPVSDLHRYPSVYRIYYKLHELQGHIKALGYEPMPKLVYEQWLKSLDKRNKKTFPKP